MAERVVIMTMQHCRLPAITTIALATFVASVGAEDWHVATDGTASGRGTRESPWDIESALGGRKEIAAGDTLWIARGTYKHPDRKLGSAGYVVRLAGEAGKPIQVRVARGERVTIDGGLTVQPPATHLWLWDLEILVSENFTMSRRVQEPGSHPKSYHRPWGGLNVHSGTACKYINLVIHDNAQGVSLWSGATDSELHGCILYDNGWEAPDRGHGHAIYTQNEKGTKTISDCIMTGGYGYTMHAYGSSRAYVDNYRAEGNICYSAGPFLIGGGRPSRNIRVLDNYLFQVGMQIGYDAPHNEDCEVRRNMIVGGRLTINKFKQVVNEQNLVLAPDAPRPTGASPRVVLRPNRYDPDRAHVALFHGARQPAVELPLDSFLKPGDGFRLLSPRDFYGKPIQSGRFDGSPIRLRVDGEFTALVVLRDRPR
jgi:hypothetical protein